MRLLLAAIVVLMITSLAIAAPETRQLGPYTVSLNVNTNNYQVLMQSPQETPSLSTYSMLISTDNSTYAGVRIINYKNLTDSTHDVYKNLVGLSMALKLLNVTTIDDRTIDGKQGFVAVGMPVSGVDAPAGFMYSQADYWLDSKPCECGPVSVGTTLVDIVSTYPQDVTNGILSSIHVAQGQAAAGEMPPAQMMPQ